MDLIYLSSNDTESSLPVLIFYYHYQIFSLLPNSLLWLCHSFQALGFSAPRLKCHPKKAPDRPPTIVTNSVLSSPIWNYLFQLLLSDLCPPHWTGHLAHCSTAGGGLPHPPHPPASLEGQNKYSPTYWLSFSSFYFDPKPAIIIYLPVYLITEGVCRNRSTIW